MPLLIATTNPGKVREFAQMLGQEKLSFLALSDYAPVEAVEETGSTFAENADIKAVYYAQHFKTFALADDSGLEVDSLAGKPGVHSARWAQLHDAGRGDQANNRLLLEQLQVIPCNTRAARFVCALSLADPLGRVVLRSQGMMEGRILREAVGTNGFGYDPLFYIDELGATSAQLPPGKKHEISHRGKALRELKKLLEGDPELMARLAGGAR